MLLDQENLNKLDLEKITKQTYSFAGFMFTPSALVAHWQPFQVNNIHLVSCFLGFSR